VLLALTGECIDAHTTVRRWEQRLSGLRLPVLMLDRPAATTPIHLAIEWA